MSIEWIKHFKVSKELFSPFELDNDYYYKKDLNKKYDLLLSEVIKLGGDECSITIIKRYHKKIIESINHYYKADISKSGSIIKNLIKEIGENPIAVSSLNNSLALHGNQSKELQFFRSRVGDQFAPYSIYEMLYLPEKIRAKAGGYRFSIPGNPCWYLSNSSYGCWIETGFPTDDRFYVSPVVLDGKQKILNLAVFPNTYVFDGLDENQFHCWLKLYMLSIATSYRIMESDRLFFSEYIVSQLIMIAAKKLGYDGVAYYSKRVVDERFALCAINIALFVDYDKEESGIRKHVKMGVPFNYGLFKQLQPSLKYKRYEMESERTGLATNIGIGGMNFPYRETQFYEFDEFLFANWEQKDSIPWGV